MNTPFSSLMAATLASLIANPVLAQGTASAPHDPPAGASQSSGATAAEDEALAAGVDAAIYGLPLVLMDLTMQKATNFASASTSGFGAPVNQFAHVKAFPTANFKDVVRANVDTLYSSAFLDLSKEPIVLSVPDTGERYYLLPMMDAWSNVFASPGARTTGTKAGRFAIVGPNWSGTLPIGITPLKAPTNLVWVLGRTQTNGPSDYASVHTIQSGYVLTPLSQLDQPFSPAQGHVDPAVDMKTPPVERLKAMSATEFFGRLASLLKANPQAAADSAAIANLARIGIVASQPFAPEKLDPAIRAGLDKALPLAFAKLEQAEKHIGKPTNGWQIPSNILGAYGTNYSARAVIALIAFGANLPADAIYPTTFVDADGHALTGQSKYRLHFTAGATPPVNAFWSVTMYDAQSYFIANPINRQAISSWMPLQLNADGSLDIIIQHDSPGSDWQANWLPAPAGAFNMTMRMYWPKDTKPSIIDGSWSPPPVKLVE
jgi:hypothetical protein